jgi:hypothetical protein
MSDQNSIQLTIKELPESADDSVVTEFLDKTGCKVVGRSINHDEVPGAAG